MNEKPEYKSGYALVERVCVPCGTVKSFPSRNKFCSPQCAVIGRSTQIATLMDPEATIDEILEPTNGFAENARTKTRMAHPKGWEASVEIEGDRGTIVTAPLDNDSPTSAQLLEGADLDPDVWDAVPTKMKKWQLFDESWRYSFACRIQRKRSSNGDDPTYAEQLEEIRNHVPAPVVRFESGEAALVVCIADTQAGKDDGNGTSGMKALFLSAKDSISQRMADLKTLGHKIDTLYVFGMGDLIEGCGEFYAQQTYRVELNRREQVNLMRRLIAEALMEWAPQFERVVVACVPGNHGENRKDGKSFTDFGDNDDVAIFEQLEDMFKMNSAYSNVSFVIPKSELSVTLDIHGVIYGLTHGHAAGNTSGGIPQTKIKTWWTKQTFGKTAIGDADVLITAHYHHFSIIQSGRRTHMQCPALECGSEWFENQSGEASPPGVLSFLAGKNVHSSGRGWTAPEAH